MSSKVEELVNAELGAGDAAAYARIRNNPKLSGLLIENVRASDDPAKASDKIKEVLGGRAPRGEGAAALRVLCMGMCDLYGAKAPGARAVESSRPKVAGLPEALNQGADLKESNGLMLSAFSLNPAVARADAQNIEELRALWNVGVGLVKTVYTALADKENDAAARLRDGFSVVRPLVVQNLPEDAFQQIHTYLYGSAEDAAQRVKEDKAQGKVLEGQLMDKITLAMKKQARDDAAGDLDAAANELRQKRAEEIKKP